MAEQLLIALSLILGVAAIIALCARIIKQPPIIAYLIAGIVVGPMFLNIIGPTAEASEFIDVFARIGIALLLFIVGLSLDFRVLKEFGRVSILAGIGSIVVTAAIGMGIATWLGFAFMSALYLSIALCFSSTVVVVKILSDKKEMDTLHGRIALGILIVESFVAAIVLMLLPVLQTGSIETIFIGIGKMVLLGLFALSFSMIVLKRGIDYIARNQEVLFLTGIAYALLLAALFNYFGLSLEIGALIAGISMASSKYALEISSKVRPLRDFFVIILFVFFGSQLTGPISGKIISQAAIFSITLLLMKPLVVMSFMRWLGYKKRTNFLTGASLAQMSEFSLIVILLGYNLGVLGPEIMNLTVLISLATVAVSSYSIYYSSNIFNKISHLLTIFDGKTKERSLANKEYENYEAILFGYHRMGNKILQTLLEQRKKVLVVDYNPKVILTLAGIGVNCIYGDAGDSEFLSELKLGQTKLVISTVPDEETNLHIKKMLEETSSKAIFVATAEQPRAALDLYNHGADYVIIPHHLGGEFMANLINKFGFEHSNYKALGEKHKKSLIKRRDDPAL